MKQRIIFLFFWLLSGIMEGQPADGFRYQTTLRNSAGNPYPTQTVGFRFSLYAGSSLSNLVWQEDHHLTTDVYGHVSAIIGTGSSTGAGSAPTFSTIDWSNSAIYLVVDADLTLSGSYTNLGNAQLFSVPYAFFSQKSAGLDSVRLSFFQDVDLTGIASGKCLKWDGTFWRPMLDAHHDTVLFSYSTGTAFTVDTALFATVPVPDSVNYALSCNSSTSTVLSGNASNTGNANQADTALYSLASDPVAWVLTGNAPGMPGNFLGTLDSADLSMRTTNTLRWAIKAAGNFKFGSGSSVPRLGILSTEGVLLTGSLYGGSFGASGAGVRFFFYPSKGSFRAGATSGTAWDTLALGQYSMAVGYNTLAGINSFAGGYNTEAVDYSFAYGFNSHATAAGAYPGGNSIAIGDSSYATATRSIAMGKGNVSSSTTCITMGRNNRASGSVSMAFGINNTSAGNNCFVGGSNASTNSKSGSFIYADASTASLLLASAINQFTVRANGGYVFYSDSARTMGVMLAAGSGSWSSVSDRNKKMNFQYSDPESILEKIADLKIYSWNYRSQSNRIRHIGPMAQELFSSFGFGESNKNVNGVDIDGVILNGIKGLDLRLNRFSNLMDMPLFIEQADQLLLHDQEMNDRLDNIEKNIKKY